MKQRKMILLSMVLLTMLLSACSAAETVSNNISKESDEFRVIRRVVFYNSLTDTYIMEMVGNISVDIDRDNVIEVIAKVGPDAYQKHYLGLSDNVTYTVEQLRTSDVSEYDYKMIFKPEKIVPIDIEYKTGEESME
ncbi:hypothetical protein SAMN05421839_1398 [Halolactibacillus halophilus]|uniref:Uncharacterized protein n=1 Tax=Halolactibacillus halophilus TaxID=306540 RepID=A0A1I5S4W2_9BACI|nr:hypothetical protein [Halolactibacillus halophilus]GEM02964.1 hypothetical protein HHA03_24960 [Halolactibacillus halophilus]SFP65651.1 hypothetical protein SAMN05421839_1398 [Halolactibacillus halophilus]